MKRSILFLISFLTLAGIVGYIATRGSQVSNPPGSENAQNTAPSAIENPDSPLTKVVAENLDTPWGIAFLPNGDMLVAERPGNVKLIADDKDPVTVATLPQVEEISEGGLLGISLHPQFALNNYVYLYYTYAEDGINTLNRVARMRFEDNQLIDEEIIVDRIPGAPNHNGGRIKFGPDNFLYIATGDAQEPSLSQNRNSLTGKILRVTDEGEPASGNPFGNTVYSYGHRNPQGLAWDNAGVLWATEHGPSTNDEVNKIEPGNNYGWPEIQGTETRSGMETPLATSGTSDTWAPAGAALVGDMLYFGGLRGEALFSYATENGSDVTVHFEGEFGRIREVITGPDGMLYITTSNNDGRGSPAATDDRIIRVNPNKL